MDLSKVRNVAKFHASGFTLVEMLVVIVIMSILMTAGAIGLNGMGGKGVTSGVASAESLFDEARAVAVGQRTRSRVLIARTLTNNPAENLRRVVVANEALKADGTPDTNKWVLSSRATTLPDQVFFSQTLSKLDQQNGTGTIKSDMSLTTPTAAAGTYFYYEFNAEGICTTPGASFVVGNGARAVTATADQPKVTAAGKKDFGGFVVWRNGRTSTFRSPDQISSTIKNLKPGDKF